MRCNVDLLKIIQVGITLSDEDGNYPQENSTWQFNFRFSVRYVSFPRSGLSFIVQGPTYVNSDDMYAPDSIDLLEKSGIDFQRHEEMGISPIEFAEFMITSGLVLTDETKWISFHR